MTFSVLRTLGSSLCLGLVASGTLLAQHETTESFVCHYVNSDRLRSPQDICNYLSYTSNRHAERVVERILQPVGLTRNFVVVECPNTENCFATVVDGKRFIIYDGQFMKQVESITNTDWSAISIVAHEIGHHLQGHTIDGMGSRPGKELEADRFSGFVLHQLGATLDESLIAIRTLSSEENTSSHPGLGIRVEAISRGWNEAERLYPLWTKAAPAAVAATASRSNGGTYRPAPKAAPEEGLVETDITYRAPEGCVTGDCYEGPGVLMLGSRKRYEGEFQNGKKHGFGVQFHPNGSVQYKGDFRQDQREGKGTYYFTNGDAYVGYFVNNVPHGKGTYHYADGEMFVGNFRRGVREGYGVLQRSDGRREPGYYRNDERVR